MNNVDMYNVDIFSVKSVKSVCNVESGHVCRMTADRILSQILPAPVTLLLHLLITILILVPEYACPLPFCNKATSCVWIWVQILFPPTGAL